MPCPWGGSGTMKHGDRHRNRTRGFSLVELIVVFGILGFLATTAALVISQRPGQIEDQKLVHDVKALNAAVQSYIVFGGSLEDAVTPADVIAKLKSKADDISAKQIAGLTGSHVDPRLTVRMQDVDEAVAGEPRAVWNTATQRFEIVNSGPAGVKVFALGSIDPDEVIAPESRDAGMKLAVNDRWIWDFDEMTAADPAGPTGIVTGSGGTGGPGVPVGGGGGPAPPKIQLHKPAFSVPEGHYYITEFPMTLYLLNPNPALYSRVMYQMTGGGWAEYAPGTPLVVAPGSIVTAYTQTLAPDTFIGSDTRQYAYAVKPIRLDKPVIYPTATKLDYVTMPSVVVQIVDANPASLSRLEYRINTSAWTDYTGPITLNAVDYPKGAKIRARAMPVVEHYTNSATAEQLISRPTPLFGGSGTAWFSDPQGGQGMVTNLGAGLTDTYFRWGVPHATGADPSWMIATGNSFSGMEPGVRFEIAQLEYFNGTIMGSTAVDGIKLNVQLDFETGHTNVWDFDLELINTPNGGRTPEEAADIVHLASLTSSSSTTIDGDEFYLILEFGETTAGGFSSLDQFHVLEGEAATGTIYATLVPAEDLDDVDPIYLGDGDVDYWDLDPGAEVELAPLLLGLDATVFDKSISSIKEIADEHSAPKEEHKRLKDEYKDLAEEYEDLADAALLAGDSELAAEYADLAESYWDLHDEHKELFDYYKGINANHLLSEDIYKDERKDIFEDWQDAVDEADYNWEIPSLKVDNPWMRWSTDFAGDEVLLPGGTLTNHGWFTLPEDKPWAGEKFATGDVDLKKLRRVKNADFLESDGLSMLLGRTVVAVVYQDHITGTYGGDGAVRWDLSKGRLGRIAFTVTGIELPGGLDESTAPGSLWDLRVRIESPIEPTIYDLDPWTRDVFIDSETGEVSEGGINEINV